MLSPSGSGILELPRGRARLEPLAPGHAADLIEAGRDEAVWRWMPCPPPRTLEAMRAFIAEAQARAEGGREVPFAIIDRACGRAAGSTRYLDIQPAHRSL
jgi:RimJ/RimL family protein N-acetyltransferase